MEVLMMLDLMFLEGPNKLLQLINFKNTLMNQKPKFRRMLRPEFLEFQEFQKLLRKLCLLQNLKLSKLSQFQKIIQLTLMEMEIKMLKLLQLLPLMPFLSLLHTQQPRFSRMNTNNFQLSTKTSLKKIKKWKNKLMLSKMRQNKKHKC